MKAEAAKTLDENDIRILEACLLNPEASQREIAAALGIGHRTVNRRINQPHFQHALREQYRERVEHAAKIYVAYATHVARELVSILTSQVAKDRDVIKAACAINRMIEFTIAISITADRRIAPTIDPTTFSDEELRVLAKMLGEGTENA